MIDDTFISDVNFFLQKALKASSNEVSLHNLDRVMTLIREKRIQVYDKIYNVRVEKRQSSYARTKELEKECFEKFSKAVEPGHYVRVVGVRNTNYCWRRVVSCHKTEIVGEQAYLGKDGSFVCTGQYTNNGYGKIREIWSNPVDKAAKYFLEKGYTEVSAMDIKKWIMPKYKLSTLATELMIQRRLDHLPEPYTRGLAINLKNFVE